MKRIVPVVVIGLMLSVAGCSSDSPSTEAPRELRRAFTVNGYEIGPGADLTNANLTNANLTNANLTYANLTAAELTNANLTNANLSGADLTNANLSGADLTNADLTGANLSGTNFSLYYPDPSNAIYSYANLTNANLTYTILDGGTGFGTLTGADLTGACTLTPQQNGENQFIEGFEIKPCATTPITTPPITTPPITTPSITFPDQLAGYELDFIDSLTAWEVEKACEMVRDLQPPNGNNSDTVMEFLTETAEGLVERAYSDAKYGNPESVFQRFGFALDGVLAHFDKNSDSDRMPLSALLVESECERFGW